jgi:hypothetical protein
VRAGPIGLGQEIDTILHPPVGASTLAVQVKVFDVQENGAGHTHPRSAFSNFGVTLPVIRSPGRTIDGVITKSAM